MTTLDKLGNSITQGSFVVYAIRDGNSSDMRFGLVIEPRGDDVSLVSAAKSWKGGFELLRKGGRNSVGVENLIMVPRLTFPSELAEMLAGAYNKLV